MPGYGAIFFQVKIVLCLLTKATSEEASSSQGNLILPCDDLKDAYL